MWKINNALVVNPMSSQEIGSKACCYRFSKFHFHVLLSPFILLMCVLCDYKFKSMGSKINEIEKQHAA